MDVIRFGRAFRAIRQRRGLRQQDVADRVDVSRSTIGRIEQGRVGRMPFATLRKVGEALDADVELNVRWHGEGLDRLLDEAHAEIVDVAVRELRAAGWKVAVEVSFAIAGERGSIDILGWHPETEYIAVGEVKSVVPDSQATLYGVDRKARLAPIIARDRGWTCRGVARLLFVGEGRTARRRVERHAAMFAAAFPVRGREVLAWLRRPAAPPIAGLVFIDPRRTARATTARRPNSSFAHRVSARQHGSATMPDDYARDERGNEPFPPEFSADAHQDEHPTKLP